MPNPYPPRWAAFVLSHMRPQGDADILLGDLEEEFLYMVETCGLRRAHVWYARQALRSLPLFTQDLITWSLVMFVHYVKVMVRHLQRQRAYASINIVGLAMGLAVSLLILLYVKDELSYDRYLDHADRLYRVTFEGSDNDASIRIATTEAPLAATLVAQFPEVEQATRLRPAGPTLITDGERTFYENRVYFADSTVFDLFSFPFLFGNPQTALTQPNTMVVTADLAEKYFGRQDVLGRTVRWDNTTDYTITGVLENLPQHSHLPFNLLASMAGVEEANSQVWGGKAYATYARLRDGANPKILEAKFPDLIKTYKGAWLEQMLGMSFEEAVAAGQRMTYEMQPLTDIHLYSDLDYEIAEVSSINYVYILSAIALFVLLIACINFMNLSTARSANRAQEVGMRKVLGSGRSQLVKQFMGESLFMAILAALLALGVVYALLPAYGNLAGKTFVVTGEVLLLLIGITLGVGLAAGVYPAVVLSSFKPQAVLKGTLSFGSSGGRLRNGLVVVQFTIAIGLIICTAIMAQQLRFMQDQRLGFDQEHVVVLPIESSKAQQSYEAFRTQLLQDPSILHVAAASAVPGRFNNDRPFRIEGANADDVHDVQLVATSYDFIETLDMELLAGHGFSRDFEADGLVLNEAAVLQMGETPETAIGKQLVQIGLASENGDHFQTIVGVVKDFHFESLHQRIGPVAMAMVPKQFSRVLVRIHPDQVAESLAFIEERWATYEPGFPYNYTFLDADFGRLYETENRLGTIYNYFTAFALFIACLGLFGLASFMITQRTKEIGIRKALGATSADIVFLLSKTFTAQVLLACALAFPLAYFLMARWLQNFAYQTTMGIGVFIATGLLALLIAWMTVSYQSIKAARSRPVESLQSA